MIGGLYGKCVIYSVQNANILWLLRNKDTVKLNSARRRLSLAGRRWSVLPTARLIFFAFIISFASTACKGNHPWTGWWTPGDTVENVGYHPPQPVEKFSHKIHAGDKKIPCQYCHSSARRSQTAGISPMNTCMGCHKFVRTDSEPIQKLTQQFEAKEPVHWVKVHDMPDFVRFSHEPHIRANVDCSSCHGDVASMDTAQQVAPMQMSWCIDCHVQKGAPTSCFTCHY